MYPDIIKDLCLPNLLACTWSKYIHIHAVMFNVLREVNNVICLSIQFILHSTRLFFKDEISVFIDGNNKVAFIFLNSSHLRKYYLLII